MSIVPFAWRDRPSLIERLLPAQKLSAEAQKERKAGAGQTLTALGSYWKGRKPLILVKACVLGALLPATDNPEADLDIFEKLMAIDDDAFLQRGFRPSCFDLVKRLHPVAMSTEEAEHLFEVRGREEIDRKTVWRIAPFHIGDLESLRRNWLQWRKDISGSERKRWELLWVQSFTYLERVAASKRPEEISQDSLLESILAAVNTHLGTDADSLLALVEQLGILRFGRRPTLADTFCGGGSIPFEASRLGCDVYASDLNPVACMLTWGALNIIGASEKRHRETEAAQMAVTAEVDREITELGIEHDRNGNRAKAYLYCLEVRCPQTGWLVPLAPTWVISRTRNVIARLVPDRLLRQFNIEILSGVSSDELKSASEGTFREGEVIYELDGEIYKTKYSSIRGDMRLSDGTTGNKLRRWDKTDFMPQPDDILRERLYCVQWIERESVDKGRQITFFAQVSKEDLTRERKVEEVVRENLPIWHAAGLVPDMEIEPGDETTRLGRERGWTYWHHLFSARQLLGLALLKRAINRHPDPKQPALLVSFCIALDNCSKLCSWNSGHPGSGEYTAHVFYNQALNTFFSYSARSVSHICDTILAEEKRVFECRGGTVLNSPASRMMQDVDFGITDPPYADAIRYHEITEYFIAWLRKAPPQVFADWLWDSRRSLAIQGSGDDFRQEMTKAYRTLSNHTSSNGLQIVMFTHQDAGVWADMAAIVWGAGLQVTAAWYIATETSSETKKGGYVQGTVLLILRKRLQQQSTYKDELVQEVRAEVARQIETMTGLNQSVKGAGRSENLFEDQDLQMAGYAAALRVLTGYSKIDGEDMEKAAIRPQQRGGQDMVKEIIDFAVQVANEHLVPDGISAGLWERLTGPERFYLRMLDMEAAGAKKLDNYQNFAKAFRFGNYTAAMGSTKPNDARLRTALELRNSEFEGDFGKSPLRAVLFALYELQRDVDIDEAISHLRDLVPGYLSRREDLMALASVIASKREVKTPAEAQAARILFSRIKNERLG